MNEFEDRYYLDLACAYVRGRLPGVEGLSGAELFRHGMDAGLKLHRFKKSSQLPRVRRVFGLLRQLAPTDLLDIGSGRGVFLWPLLDEFPDLAIHCVDIRDDRVRDIRAVAAGGIGRLTAETGDVTNLARATASADGVTILEVLEHLHDPAKAVAEAVRVSRRFVIASVPSQPDDNPEHIRLFTGDALAALFHAAGVSRVSVDYVRNHIVALAHTSDMP
jgi:ubiquinone/menaquinone biosynthesis C-methylase UbiE